MFNICLFDLDETLIRTDDIKELREAGKNNSTPEYQQQVRDGLSRRRDRHIYDQALLQKLRASFSLMKFGVFTRSPRSYARTALEWAYPGFAWDIIIAYEDVRKRKPSGEGIDVAMQHFDMLNAQSLPRTILVGDSDVDVKSAYNCGCVVALDRGDWPSKLEYEHWGALEHVPDAIIDSPAQIFEVLSNPADFLPALERALTPNLRVTRPPRFDKLGHFIPKAAGGGTTPYQIYVCGRSFANYDSVQYRKQWHRLTHSIEANKESDVFPIEWVETVRSFIVANFVPFMCSEVVVATVPHRPERKARLENFLMQLVNSITANPIRNIKVSCRPDLLAYKPGVRSQHGDHLSRDARFVNVRDHLFVQQSEMINGRAAFLIIDDVVTTGASLIYSQKYLTDAGAMNVKLLSMAKNVGNISR